MVSLEKLSGIQTPKRSLWTIEIVHLLHQFGVRQLIYTTTCLGVNHDYLRKLKFYAEQENEDIGVINALFKVRVLATLLNSLPVVILHELEWSANAHFFSIVVAMTFRKLKKMKLVFCDSLSRQKN